jgi:hypothetical protein
MVQRFIDDVFDKEGEHVKKEYPKTISKLCDFCELNNTELCQK